MKPPAQEERILEINVRPRALPPPSASRKPRGGTSNTIRWDRRKHALRIGQARTSGWRLASQLGFSLLSLALGFQFAHFVEAAGSTLSGPLPGRPPGVEGYLPISGLMGALDWVYRGTLNTIHPAATVLFLVFVAISLLLRKSFCSWICPAGFVSETLARLGRLILGRNVRPPRWLDVPLRGLKYLLLGFFLWAIFRMTPLALQGFLESPYNQVADVKMLEFFSGMSSTGWIVMGALVFLSIPIQGFWCRYLCPYGALLGLFARLSPVRVRRNAQTCTDCGICDRVCPSRLPVSKRTNISSVECAGCMDCVVSCPISQALRFGTPRRTLSPVRTGLLVLALFLVGVTTARLTGHWYSEIPDAEMRRHVSGMKSGAYGHPGMN